MRIEPHRVRLSPPVRKALAAVAGSTKASHREVCRARIALFAARGMGTSKIARRVGCSARSARKWRARFAAAPCIETLADEHRSGRPQIIAPEVRCHLIKLACDRPQGSKFRDVWTHETLRVALHRDTGVWVSVSEIGKILRGQKLRPHHWRGWLHSPDPEFGLKVRRICDLYLNPPAGAHVLCVDEKTGMQALERTHEHRYPWPGQAGREEFEYKRHGTRTLIAAFNIRTGHVLGRCSKGRKAKDLVAFMDEVAARYPTGDLYIVWDNLNIHFDGKEHRWTRFNERHGNRFHFVYTPKHASWVNQIEIWFSILARRVLKHASFCSVAELSRKVSGFVRHWNRHEAHPFRWTFRGRCKHNPRRRAA